MTGSNKVAHDYALLKLKQRVQSREFIPLSGAWTELKKETKIFIGGYPRGEYFAVNSEGQEAAYQWGLVKTNCISKVK